jgi:molybdopterin/thiamine biosynthesis adenylyltransferase
MVKKILIIGVGGIGGYLAPLLAQSGQYEISLADPDTVEEKNLSYQNYMEDDIGKNKARLLSEAINNFGNGRVPSSTSICFPILTDKQLEGYDLIICCADNLDVRRLVYRQGFQSDCRTQWLDLRAQGRNGALISYLADPQLCDTFLAGPEGSFSCQGEAFNETRDGKDLHFTHAAIAGLGAQWVMRWNSGDQLKDKMVINI